LNIIPLIQNRFIRISQNSLLPGGELGSIIQKDIIGKERVLGFFDSLERILQ